MTVTLDQLAAILPKCPRNRLALLHPPLVWACREFEIGTPKRLAAFLAQVAHESNELLWFEEVWGPTPQQRKYEPPSDLATKLGNTQKGDGVRFLGRGPIQLTGRANYAAASQALGVDLLSDPARASQPDVAFRVAGWFWQSRGLNELADAGKFDAITRRINGGLNGKAHRDAYYERAGAVLDTPVVNWHGRGPTA